MSISAPRARRRSSGRRARGARSKTRPPMARGRIASDALHCPLTAGERYPADDVACTSRLYATQCNATGQTLPRRRRPHMRHLTKAIALVAIIAAEDGAVAQEWNGCDSPDLDRKIASCTRLIETPDLDPAQRARAFLQRGYSYLRLGQYQRAI